MPARYPAAGTALALRAYRARTKLTAPAATRAIVMKEGMPNFGFSRLSL